MLKIKTNYKQYWQEILEAYWIKNLTELKLYLIQRNLTYEYFFQNYCYEYQNYLETFRDFELFLIFKIFKVIISILINLF